MAERWCKEHQAVFFKKGKMKGYAHPITDDDGEPTGEWCNEPEAEKPSKEMGRQGSTNESIEQQVAFKGFVEMIVAGVLLDNSREYQAAMNWANSKLANWASMGQPPKEKVSPSSEPLSTKEQRGEIFATASEKGYSNKAVLKIMLNEYQASSTVELTKKQATGLIAILKAGKFLEGIEPEDMPF